MKSGMRDDAEGKLTQAKGHIKEAAGKATGDPELRDEGKADRAVGKVQEKVGQIKKVFEQ
jgi:uncharacterized protein YjbJ (UPF0337 family)